MVAPARRAPKNQRLGRGRAGFESLISYPAVSAPASAASRITLGPLVPVAPINTIDTAAGAGTCQTPDSAARITSSYSTRSLNISDVQPGHSTAQIMLELDSMGNLLQARVANSSGTAPLDEQALIAARGSKYAPEVRNCSSFKRSYLLDVTFDVGS